ncbi:hypothetical protein QBC41DRAFT_371756 [Cercophora samala]|uniref:Uncharacterized protein n=1 Tax=Cercophora samala TaxID=330535 RepID=A0AA40DCM5_9PEZI|nr:hypothetical protein QBC41DRAFT_371756 [Cercophora samala]
MSSNNTIADFRLQVWRYTPRGRNYKDNESTAKFLTQHCDLKGWTAQPSSLDKIDDQPHGNFVPLEVNFRFKVTAGKGDRRYDHIADLMELFELVFPSKLEEFFLPVQQHTTTHHMVLVPFGNRLAKETVYKHTRVKILRSLEIQSSIVVERSLITPIDMCNLALEVVRGSAVGADVATIVRALPTKWVTGASMIQEYDRLRKLITATRPEAISGPLKTIEDVANAWNKAEPCLDLMSTMIRHIDDCLDLKSLSGKNEIPPQQLYETMLGLRNANIFFSAYQGQMLSIADATPALMSPPQGIKIVVGAATAAAVVAAAAALLVYTFFTGGTGLIVAGGVSGAAFGGGATAGIGEWKRNKHASLCENFSQSIVELGDALTTANVALAVTYSQQVLQLPLHSKQWVSSQYDDVLRQLGIDTQQLKKVDFQGHAVEKVLREVLYRYSNFVMIREKLQKAAGVRTRRELAPKLDTQISQRLQIRSSPRAQTPVVSQQQAIGAISAPSTRSTRQLPSGGSSIAGGHITPSQQQLQQRNQFRSLPAAPSQNVPGLQQRSLPIQPKNTSSALQSQQSKSVQSRLNPAAPVRQAPNMQGSTSW